MIDIFRQSPLPVLMLEVNAPDFTIIECNPAFEVFSGLTREALVGHPAAAALSRSARFSGEDWPARFTESLEKVVQFGEPHHTEVTLLNGRSGSENHPGEQAALAGRSHFRAVNSPVRDEDGNLIRILHTVTDLPGPVQPARELQVIHEQTEEVYVWVDERLRIVSMNRRFVELTWNRFRRHVAIGESVLDYVEPDRLDRFHACYRKALEGEQIEYAVNLPDGMGAERIYRILYKPATDSDGRIHGVFVSLIDISEQTWSRQSLEQILERFRLATRASRDIIWDWDLQTNSVVWGENYSLVFGYRNEVTTGLSESWLARLHPDDRDQIGADLRDAIEDGAESWNREYRFRRADGRYLIVEDNAYFIRDESGRAIRMIGATRDITEQRDLEFQLRERIRERECLYKVSLLDDHNETVESLLSKAIELIPEGFQYPEKAKAAIIWNGKRFQSPGFTESVRRMSFESSRPGSAGLEAVVVYPESRKGEEPPQFLEEEYRLMEALAGLLSGKIDRIQQNEQLLASLKEKEILMAEIHHRVKNNLAVVAALMEIQAAAMDDPEIESHLGKAIMRVRSIADIHELLYQSKDFSKLDFSENLRLLATKVIAEIHQDQAVDYKVICSPMELNINQAIPLTLIVNEVLTNILKYAFRDRPSGRITLSLDTSGSELELRICDNGSPIPGGSPESDGSTLGLQLIDLLSKQLLAEYRYESNDGGTCFILRFDRAEIKGTGSYFIQ